MSNRRPALLMLAAIGLAGCASTTRNDNLTATLYAYQSLVRWGHFEDAAAMVDPDYLKQHPISALDWDRFRQIQISSYNASAPIPAGENEIQVSVELEYINIHRQTPRAILDHQVWRYDPEAKKWWLTTGLPDLSQGR